MGRLRLAFVSTVGFEPLPRGCAAFAAVPAGGVELSEATGDVQLQAFARGEIDAGFDAACPRFRTAGPGALAVAEEPLVLALPGCIRWRAGARCRLPPCWPSRW